MTTGIKPTPPAIRVERRLAVADRGFVTPCRVYPGAKNLKGYGTTNAGSLTDGTCRTVLVHRVIYAHHHGAIPAGYDIDHLCRQHDCCEITHLEAVTRSENIRRGLGPGIVSAKRRAQTHCKRDHPLSGDNVRFDRYGRRCCRTCAREAARRWYHNQKAAV